MMIDIHHAFVTTHLGRIQHQIIEFDFIIFGQILQEHDMENSKK